jgi:6-phosphogluconolactonase/glucosamine-6-phosphate isomerase/deaminase
MDEGSFLDTYKEDVPYVSVVGKGLKIDSRASLTPSWLQNNVDDMLLFVIGESKQMMLESLINESKEIHERPSELIKRHKNAHLFTDLLIEPK